MSTIIRPGVIIRKPKPVTYDQGYERDTQDYLKVPEPKSWNTTDIDDSWDKQPRKRRRASLKQDCRTLLRRRDHLKDRIAKNGLRKEDYDANEADAIEHVVGFVERFEQPDPSQAEVRYVRDFLTTELDMEKNDIRMDEVERMLPKIYDMLFRQPWKRED
jgi:hypothetical protein